MIDMECVLDKFERLGARVRIREQEVRTSRWQSRSQFTQVDVRKDNKGEYFDLLTPVGGAELVVLDVRPRDRHLLLLVRDGVDVARGVEQAAKSKYLCGHDERHWFTAAIPESAPVGAAARAGACECGASPRQRSGSLPSS